MKVKIIERKNGDTDFIGDSWSECAKEATAYLLAKFDLRGS